MIMPNTFSPPVAGMLSVVCADGMIVLLKPAIRKLTESMTIYEKIGAVTG